MAQRRQDDLNLSLTGSQISVLSARSNPSRPSSAQAKKANSMVDVRPNLPNGNSRETSAKKRRGSLKGETPPTSHRSAASAPVTNAAVKPTNGATASQKRAKDEDFLSFFENSSAPKIKQPLSSSNSNTQKKKPSSNAVKVLWGEPQTKPTMKKPAWTSKPPSQNSTARSEGPEPHNIFRPTSVLSTDDELEAGGGIIEELGNSLSQSINKLQSLQRQFSGVNKQSSQANGEDTAPSTGRSAQSDATITPRGAAVASRNKFSPGTGSIEDFIQDIIDRTPMHDDSPRAISTGRSHVSSVSHDKPSDAGDNSGVGRGRDVLANNISHAGQVSKAKASLSSMENSYQNIKHKTPVNQVNSSQGSAESRSSNANATQGPLNTKKPNDQRPSTGLSSNFGPSNSSSSQQKKSQSVLASKKSAPRGTLENYLDVFNSAATKIQKWYRRHKTRHQAAEAAMKRLLSQKKQEHEIRLHQELTQSVTAAELEEKKAEERKRVREDKAKEARQQAIKDLKKKREERKDAVKKIAEEEIQYLQASGRITKTPSTNSQITKKKKSSREGLSLDPQNTSGTPMSATPLSSARDVAPNPTQPVIGETDEDSGAVGGTDKATEANTRTTLEDLYSTLKKLEAEENFLSARAEKKKSSSWLDELEKDQEGQLESNLTAENLEKLNCSKDALSKSGFLSNDKLKSIINFLDDVQVTDRLSEIDTEISRMNETLERPALLVPSADEVAQLENAQAAASEVTNTVLSQRLELDEKKRTVSMLQKALNQQRELTVRHAKETEKEMKKRLDVQKDEYEEAIKRHLSFIDQLIDDKKNLGEKCEKLVTELKTVDKKYQDKMKSLEENHTMEITKLKEVHSAAEKLRREKWIEDKTKKIKEMTVKGLEPEIQRLIAKHKSEMKKVKQIHEAELLEADERAAQKYVKMTEELRDQLATEKEAACAREREMSKQRYEKQLQQEEEAYQQQRRRLYQEVQEEKDRVASGASRQRSELESLRRQLEDSHRHSMESMREEYDKAKYEQEKRHEEEITALQEKLKLEKESWEENYMKRHETWLVQKERELRDKIKKERDKEIELVIERLEEDASTVREENERSTEQKIRRLREKFETETRELEISERKAVQKHNEIKAKMTEVEGENERLKVIIKQKEQEIFDNKKLLEKMNSERSHVSDIIRQEFADRIVATDEENKRIKHEISELRARNRVDLEKKDQDMEELRKAKDEEMEEVHKRVKQAIVKKEEVVAQLKQQYQAANKRADHLEGLLEQQRKQLLGTKK